MEYIAQNNFQLFLDKQASDNYNWDNMTDEEQNIEMKEYTRLKILSEKEKKNNQKENEINNNNYINQKEKETLLLISNDGYDINNLKESFERFWGERPEYFGSNKKYSNETKQDFIYLYSNY